MSLKNIYFFFQIILFTFFFFLWGVQFNPLEYLNIFEDGYSLNIRLSYFIVLLIIPFIYHSVKMKSYSFYKLFNYQKNILFLIIFIILHYFTIKILYSENIIRSELINLIYLIILSLLYCNYRNFLSRNFEKIIFFYLFIFVFFSIYDVNYEYNTGQCNVNFFLINFFKKYLNIYLTNSFYLEN